MSNDTPRMRIGSLGDITEVVPYLLGFTPQESMVLLATINGRVEVTARVDLADVQPAGHLEDMMNRLQQRFPDATLIALAYTEQPQAGWDMLRRAVQHRGEDLVPIRLLVAGDTWYDPAGGSGAVDRYGPLAAQAALHGLRRDNQRSDLAARFHPPTLTDQLRDRLLTTLDSLPPNTAITDQIRLTHHLITQHTSDSGARLDAADAMRLATLIHGRQAAELAMGLIGNPTSAEKHLELWTAVVNQLPQPLTEAPLQMAALAAWASANGALSNVAYELADQIGGRPAHTPIRTVLDLVEHQILPPTMWPEIRTAILSTIHPEARSLIDGVPAGDQHLWEVVDPPPRGRDNPGPPNPMGGRPPSGPSI